MNQETKKKLIEEIRNKYQSWFEGRSEDSAFECGVETAIGIIEQFEESGCDDYASQPILKASEVIDAFKGIITSEKINEEWLEEFSRRYFRDCRWHE